MLKSKERLIDIKIEVVASSIYIMYIVRYIWSTKAGFGVCWIELPQAPILVVYISK